MAQRSGGGFHRPSSIPRDETPPGKVPSVTEVAWRDGDEWRYGVTSTSTVHGIDVFEWAHDGEPGSWWRFGPDRWDELVVKPAPVKGDKGTPR